MTKWSRGDKAMTEQLYLEQTFRLQKANKLTNFYIAMMRDETQK